MAGKLDGKRIAILATDGVEQVELTEPRKALEQAGAQTDLVSLDSGEIQAFDHLDHGDKLTVDKKVSDVSADDYDGLLIPGGVANGDFLRADEDAVKFTSDFARAHKPIASICHGPWVLVGPAS
jgi:protease I